VYHNAATRTAAVATAAGHVRNCVVLVDDLPAVRILLEAAQKLEDRAQEMATELTASRPATRRDKEPT